jgi:FixJ family two-component response regulator
MKKQKKDWSVEDVLYVLTELKSKMAFVDWNTLNKQIAEELNTSVNSVKATLLNCQYVAIGKGLENYSQTQEEATKIFISKYTDRFFKIV